MKLYIIIAKDFEYTLHSVMICKDELSPLMRYMLKHDDIPSLSQWIKKKTYI